MSDTIEDPYRREWLLQPIPGDSPTGSWLRYDPIYTEIREARQADDPNLPQGVWERELKRADWGRVRRLCETALAERSKDLQIAVWLTECWLRQDGYPGLAAGFDLLAGLCEEYWPALYPELDEDGDAEIRMGALAWMNERLPVLIRQAPLTAPSLADSVPRALIDWENLARIQALEMRDKNAARTAAKDKPNQSELDASVAQTPIEALGDRLSAIETAQAELERLDDFLDTHCPKQAPSLSALREVLQAAGDRLQRWISDRGGLPLPDDGQDNAAEDDSEAPAQDEDASQADTDGEENVMGEERDPQADKSGVIRSRREAYRRLEEAADYLLRTEPHSPVPYMVKRAVAWGEMSFGELMMELMAEEGDKKKLLKLLGLDKIGSGG